MYGCNGLTIKWLRTYLENRAFDVQLNGELSSLIKLTCGVPQGSVLGPLLFVTYTAQLEHVMEKHNCQSHMYTDDNQIYLHCHHFDVTTAASKIGNCVMKISGLMDSNRLKLNPSKTELIWFST